MNGLINIEIKNITNGEKYLAKSTRFVITLEKKS